MINLIYDGNGGCCADFFADLGEGSRIEDARKIALEHGYELLALWYHDAPGLDEDDKIVRDHNAGENVAGRCPPSPLGAGWEFAGKFDLEECHLSIWLKLTHQPEIKRMEAQAEAFIRHWEDNPNPCRITEGDIDSLVFHYKRLAQAVAELRGGLEKLASAAENREGWSGDPIRLLVVRADLEVFAKSAREILAKMKKSEAGLDGKVP